MEPVWVGPWSLPGPSPPLFAHADNLSLISFLCCGDWAYGTHWAAVAPGYFWEGGGHAHFKPRPFTWVLPLSLDSPPPLSVPHPCPGCSGSWCLCMCCLISCETLSSPWETRLPLPHGICICVLWLATFVGYFFFSRSLCALTYSFWHISSVPKLVHIWIMVFPGECVSSSLKGRGAKKCRHSPPSSLPTAFSAALASKEVQPQRGQQDSKLKPHSHMHRVAPAHCSF